MKKRKQSQRILLFTPAGPPVIRFAHSFDAASLFTGRQSLFASRPSILTLVCLLLALGLAGCGEIPAVLPLDALPTPAAPPAYAKAEDFEPSVIPSARPSLTPTPTALTAPATPVTPTPGATSTTAPSPTPTRVLYAYGPAGFPANINPLTGLAVDDAGLLERRPMAIKVTNFPRSVRPQWGLSLADHVIEYYIADQMTRFIGIFYGTDASQVGPVRSARMFDDKIMRMYKSILVFGGADDPIMERLSQPDIKNNLVLERPDNCPPLCRLESGRGYNNLFVHIGQLSRYITERGTTNGRQNLDGLRFEADTPKSGNSGRALSIRYSIVSYHRWEYDPASGRYLRFQDAQNDGFEGKAYAPLTDSLTGEQLAADNIVVLRMAHEYFHKSSDTEIFDQPFIGQGSGYAFRDGQVYPLTWLRPAPEQMPTLLLPDGRLYPLKPGNVWFEILGETSTFEPVEDGSWNFTFSIP